MIHELAFNLCLLEDDLSSLLMRLLGRRQVLVAWKLNVIVRCMRIAAERRKIA